jgi:hypothetical protein
MIDRAVNIRPSGTFGVISVVTSAAATTPLSRVRGFISNTYYRKKRRI